MNRHKVRNAEHINTRSFRVIKPTCELPVSTELEILPQLHRGLRRAG
jgi:hypothetical protein